MKSRTLLTMMLLVLLVTSTCYLAVYRVIPNSKADEWSEYAFNQGSTAKIIIGLKEAENTLSPNMNDVVKKYSGEVTSTVSIRGRNIALAVELPWKSLSDFFQEISASDHVSYVEPNWVWKAHFVPNDPSWDQQWGPKKIKADWAWNTTVGSKDVLVTVVDTGIDWDHPDLAANYVALGYDWVNDDANPMDDEGHGTHCAGIIAAVLNNSVGIAGIANVSIMAEKGLNSSGYGTSEWLANSIIHAVDQGADIISMSWGSYYYSELIYQAIKYAYDNGVLLIASAGNEDTDARSYPAAYEEVISVSATTTGDGLASFSNYGDYIELAAPGVDIYSTVWNNGYVSWSGTSMAAPHVAGVAALIWSRFPTKSRDWVRLQLRYTADDIGSPGFDTKFGYGRINAKRAVEGNPPKHDLAIYSWTTPPYVEPGSSGTFNVTILNFGESAENNINVTLRANGSLVDSTIISSLSASESATVSLTWNPTKKGWYNITLSVTPVQDETRLDNNAVEKFIYVGKPYKAVVVDSEGNCCGYERLTWDRINTQWHLYGDVMVYIDYTSLRKEGITYSDIAATGADALIISSAWNKNYGFEFTDSEIEAIKQYVEEGHGFIISEASFCYKVPNNRKLATLVGINETLTYNYTDTGSLQILEPQHPLFKGIPNPYGFPTLITTGTPADGVWDDNELAGGRYVAKEGAERGAIVVYKRGRTYLAPWLEGITSTINTYHLQLWYNAITWSPHEVSVALESPSFVYLGDSALLNATATNIGIVNETNVVLQLLINNTVVDSTTISQLVAGESYTLDYMWTPSEGVYNITANVQPVTGDTDFANNTVTTFVIATENRDVAITEIVSPDAVYTGKPTNITVTASNKGEFPETFNVTLYYDSTVIGTHTVTYLLPGTNITLTFVWDTAGITPGQNYTLRAEAQPVLGEANLANNNMTYGPVKMKMLGDINGDRKIDILDVVAATSIYGSREGDPNWNPECDVASPWGVIDILDIVVITSRYGQTY